MNNHRSANSFSWLAQAHRAQALRPAHARPATFSDAAASDLDKAFAALGRAINYWSNSPFVFDKHWEHDAYWGDLREHPEYKRIYAEKRSRIGPIYGELHYFPGWWVE